MGPHKRQLQNSGAESDSDSDVSMTDSDETPDETPDELKNVASNEKSDADISDKDHSVNQDDEEEEEEDPLVKAFKEAKKMKPNHPPIISLEDDQIVDICLHPEKNIVALATMTGDILLYEYSNEENKLLETHELHLKACRRVEFNTEGDSMYSTAKDKAVMVTDVGSGKLKQSYEEAHDEPVYCMKCLDKNLFATGDDGGTVKLWDQRKKDAVFSIEVGEEYVSDLISNEHNRYLVSSGGDGALNAIELRKRKIYASSEFYDSDLTCMGLFRGETKLLVGSSKGIMYLFNWSQFGLHSDAYPGNKQPISCMVPITQNIVATSGEDGIIRAAHLFPHRHLGVVGQHKMPVETLDISHDGNFIASLSHDNEVRFWNIEYFEEIEKFIDVSKKQDKKKDMMNNLPSSEVVNAKEFFSGLL